MQSKAFFANKDLNIHIKGVHEGQKNYKCQFCDKKYTQSGSLEYTHETKGKKFMHAIFAKKLLYRKVT